MAAEPHDNARFPDIDVAGAGCLVARAVGSTRSRLLQDAGAAIERAVDGRGGIRIDREIFGIDFPQAGRLCRR